MESKDDRWHHAATLQRTFGSRHGCGGLGLGARRATALQTADITWTSDDPHLSGNFASIGPEIDAADLPVIAGRIPPELSGAYMRNGPNPLISRFPIPIRWMATG
jgi:Retinal pigment epithelial membrane protein